MNFPTLETCRQISAEFQNSEFVWVECLYCKEVYTMGREYLRCSSYCKANEDGHSRKAIASAPTCEELGEYLHSKGFALMREWCGIGKWILYRNNSHFAFIDGELTETQARAKAAIMVMAALKSNNEED